MTKTSIINVQGIEIALTTINEEDFICITDIVKAKGGDARAADIIKNWIRNRSTIESLGTWETLYNPDFKVVEFDHFRKEAGLPTFTMSVSNWIEKTGAIGIISKAGRYGGTYAHKDIAFEFCSAISPMFKLYVIKAKDGDFFISDWLRNRNTLEYLGAWESMFNPDFNYGEFATIKSKAGLNNFKISIKEWHKRECDS